MNDSARLLTTGPKLLGVSRALRLILPALILWIITALIAVDLCTLESVFWASGALIGCGVICAIFCVMKHKRCSVSALKAFVSQSILLGGLLFLVCFQFYHLAQVNFLAMNLPGSDPTVPTPRAVTVYGDTKQAGIGRNEQTRFTAIDHNTGAKIRISAQGDLPPMGNGAKLEIMGIPKSGSNRFMPPVITANRITILAPKTPLEKVFQTAYDLRTNLVSATKELKAAELVPGFAVGETEGISMKTIANMKEKNLLHLVAVSGANCALVTQVATLFAKMLGAGRRLRFIFSGVALLGFLTLVGPDTSVLRASVMGGVVLLSDFGSKRAGGLNSLALAIIVLLICDPLFAISAGFILSVLATAGILVLTKPIERFLQRLIWFAPRIFCLTFAVSLAATITCIPYLVTLQSGISVTGIFANILVAPFVPFATGFGLLATVLLPLSYFLGMGFVWLASVFTSIITAIADFFISFPLNRLAWPDGLLGSGLAIVCEIAVCLGIIFVSGSVSILGRRYKKPLSVWDYTKQSLATRIIRNLCFALPVVLVSMFGVVNPLSSQVFTPNNWFLFVCEDGPGSALFVRNQETSTTIMLNTGKHPNTLTDCLRDMRIQNIDLLILMHDDAELSGGLSAVISLTRQALVPAVSAKSYGSIKSVFADSGIETEPINIKNPKATMPESIRKLRHKIKLQLLTASGEAEDVNRLAVFFAVDTIRLLYTADLNEKDLSQLINNYPGTSLRSNVLITNSQRQINSLNSNVRPEYAILLPEKKSNVNKTDESYKTSQTLTTKISKVEGTKEMLLLPDATAFEIWRKEKLDSKK